MISRCRYCDKEAVIRIPYAKLSLCVDHFRGFIVSRVEDIIKRCKMVKQGDRVLLAVSGGKDSIALAHIMNNISDRIGFKLVILHIDLGIGEYSKKSREIVKNICNKLNLDNIIIDLRQDLGFTLPDFISRLRTRRICSLCGIVKRYIMNATAIELKLDAIATAHHADDILTYIVKNFVIQDYTYTRKLVPITRGIPGIAATKIKPFYEVYEKYIALYTMYSKLEFIDIECPYSKDNDLETIIRRFIDDIENKSPGIKISMLRRFANKYLQLGEEDITKNCSFCGLVSQKDICSFCKLTEKSFGKPLGIELRNKISEKFILGNSLA